MAFRRQRFITYQQFRCALAQLNERMDQMEASQQAQVDAIVAELGTVQTDLASAQTTLQAEIDSITAGTPVNLAALQAAADQLDPAVQKLASLKPTPPPTPSSAPGP